MILLEGGAAGHIQHLYEDYDLTFNKLKNIIDGLINNKIICTEKIDGMNIYFGFKNGKTKAVRNKSEFKLGGLDKHQFDEREFESGDKTKEAFIAAFNSFDRSLYNLTDQEKVDIFGVDGNIFLNCEVVSTNYNVIPYDKNFILIHRSGHKSFDEQTGALNVIPDEENIRLSKTIEILIPKLNENLSNTNFQVRQTPLKNLMQGIDSVYIDELFKELNKFGFNEDLTIKDFLHTRIVKKINETIKNIKISEQLANKILDLPTNEIVLSDSDVVDKSQLKKSINFILSNKSKIKKEAIKPIEDVIHKIGVLLLQNQKSDFIENNEQAIEKIKNELETSINKVQTLFSQDEEKLEKASREIEKIGSIDNIQSAIEGIVFQINNKLYKITGNFAPINQIINLTENVVPNTTNTIVIYPGRFQPFHKGHMAAYRYLTNKFGEDKVNIFTSDKVDERSPLSFEDRKKIINFAGVPNQYIWYSAEPYKAEEVVNNIKSIDPNKTVLVYAISMKDMIEDPRFSFKANEDGSPSYMQPYKDKFEPMSKHCYVLTYPKVDFNVMGKEFDSSTQIRDYFNTLDNDEQRLFIKDLYGRYSKDIQSIMNKKPDIININEILSLINEMSAGGSGAGSLEGGMINLSSKKKVKNQETVTHSIDDILAKVNELFKEKKDE